MMINKYNKKFYNSVGFRSIKTAELVCEILLTYFGKFESIKDIGCGNGTWLKKFAETNIFKVGYGFDLPSAVGQNFAVNSANLNFVEIDFEKESYNRLPKTDLSIFVEVAEHLKSATAKKVIENICETSNIIVFSAAIPGQGGFNHINENPINYWVELIESNNFAVFDTFRQELNAVGDLPSYYRNNIVLAVSEKFLCGNQEIASALTEFRILSREIIFDYRSNLMKFQYRIIALFNYKIINKIVSFKDLFIVLKYKIQNILRYR